MAVLKRQYPSKIVRCYATDKVLLESLSVGQLTPFVTEPYQLTS
jgi:hypothetical protein